MANTTVRVQLAEQMKNAQFYENLVAVALFATAILCSILFYVLGGSVNTAMAGFLAGVVGIAIYLASSIEPTNGDYIYVFKFAGAVWKTKSGGFALKYRWLPITFEMFPVNDKRIDVKGSKVYAKKNIAGDNGAPDQQQTMEVEVNGEYVYSIKDALVASIAIAGVGRASAEGEILNATESVLDAHVKDALTRIFITRTWESAVEDATPNPLPPGYDNTMSPLSNMINQIIGNELTSIGVVFKGFKHHNGSPAPSQAILDAQSSVVIEAQKKKAAKLRGEGDRDERTAMGQGHAQQIKDVAAQLGDDTLAAAKLIENLDRHEKILGSSASVIVENGGNSGASTGAAAAIAANAVNNP